MQNAQMTRAAIVEICTAPFRRTTVRLCPAKFSCSERVLLSRPHSDAILTFSRSGICDGQFLPDLRVESQMYFLGVGAWPNELVQFKLSTEIPHDRGDGYPYFLGSSGMGLDLDSEQRDTK